MALCSPPREQLHVLTLSQLRQSYTFTRVCANFDKIKEYVLSAIADLSVLSCSTYGGGRIHDEWPCSHHAVAVWYSCRLAGMFDSGFTPFAHHGTRTCTVPDCASRGSFETRLSRTFSSRMLTATCQPQKQSERSVSYADHYRLTGSVGLLGLVGLVDLLSIIQTRWIAFTDTTAAHCQCPDIATAALA